MRKIQRFSFGIIAQKGVGASFDERLLERFYKRFVCDNFYEVLSNNDGQRTVIEVSGALPLREGETEGGPRQISADSIRKFLAEDLRLGLETSLKETPREMLGDTIEKGEWWKGIILSGAFLEHFGSRTLEQITGNEIKNEKVNLRLFQIFRLSSISVYLTPQCMESL